MTSNAEPGRSPTAIDLLFDHQSAAATIEKGWDGTSVGSGPAGLDGLGPALRRAAHGEIAQTVAGLLHVDLVDLLVSGWQKHEDLLAAARRTRDSPGTTELVELASHRVTCSERPYVDVLLDGAKVSTVDLELTVVFDVAVLVAAVRAAMIVALHSGHCDITASLGIDGVDVATGHDRIDLPLVVGLGNGIPLLSGHGDGGRVP